MRLIPLFPLILCATPLFAQTEMVDPVPGFDLQSSILCLAFTVHEIESIPDYAESRADWLIFFSRLIMAKSSPEDNAAFPARFADALESLRNPMFDVNEPATPEEADEILTGTGKMCWFQALAAEGGPYEGQ